MRIDTVKSQIPSASFLLIQHPLPPQARVARILSPPPSRVEANSPLIG